MKLLEFSYKNILSYGNKLQTFKFDDGAKLILVEGENGAGKSSIKEALTVSIYGRSAIRKMKDIPNWINKNAYTQVKFETTSGETIELDRGIDPNFSNIKINDAVFNLPDKRKVDEFIEEELSKIPFSVFCNTISLSFDDFKSFVNLTKDDKRLEVVKAGTGGWSVKTAKSGSSVGWHTGAWGERLPGAVLMRELRLPRAASTHTQVTVFVPRSAAEATPVTINGDSVTITRGGATITTPLPRP
jgi:hypothetical protein